MAGSLLRLHPPSGMLLPVWLAILCPLTSAIAQGEQVQVLLRDGRVLLGETDPATSPTRLWMNRSSPAILLRSGFAWSEILAGQIGDERLSTAELRDRLANLEIVEPLPPTAAPPSFVESPQVSPAIASRVASLQIAATLANWDSDGTLDGLLVSIQPLDQHGLPVAVDGQLELFLYGQLGRLQPFSQMAVPPMEVRELARTFHLVSCTHFTPAGAVYRLEFDHSHPDSDLMLAPEGFLRARLGIPGQGVFEATEPRVLLRPMVPFRDALQIQTGRRFFPREWREVRMP